MTQQLSRISEIKIKLPKNAKLFKDNHTGLIHLVHYDHVILTLVQQSNYKYKYKILAAYAGSPTSQDAIQTALYTLHSCERYYCMEEVYKSLGKTYENLKSDRHDYKASETGIYNKPRMVKAEWSERISALENYDWKKGSYLWQ